MKTSMNFLTKLFATLFVFSMWACSDDDDDIIVSTPSSVDFNINRSTPNVTFDKEAVVMGVNGDDALNVAISLCYLIPNFTAEVTENTKLLIVPELSQEYEKEITTVYNNGGVIAVTDPSQDQLTKWFDANDWESGIVPANVDDALIFSFSNGFHCCLVYGPDDKNVIVDTTADNDTVEQESSTNADTSDDGVEYIWIDFQNPQYPEVYNYLSPWIDVVNKDFEKAGITEDEAESVKQQFLQTRADDSSQMLDVSQVFARYPYSIIAPFTANAMVRWLAGNSNPDVIKGTGAVTVSFNIYQIHCYEDQPGAGDYYLVNMTAGLASADMYKGKWWNQHSGTYVRICGLYAKEFAVVCMPYHQPSKTVMLAPYSSKDVELLETPKPLTTVGKTQYDDSFTFGVDASLSVSGGTNVLLTPYFEVKPSISLGWKWTESTVRGISDTDIRNISGATTVNGTTVSTVGWRMLFNNLPQFQWSQDYGFNEGNSLTYRSTNYLHANWVWHQKDVKDDSTEDPITIRVQTEATYGAMSFISTESDLQEKTFRYGCIDHYINLKPFSRDRCGTITLENNFTDKTAITEIEIYKKKSDGSDGDLVWSTDNTLKPTKKVTTPALRVADKYIVYFTTNTGKKYKYSTYPALTIELGMANNIYSKVNFTEVK